MEKFKKIIGIAAPFTRINVDTDLIIPAENLKTISKQGLGKNLFSYIRFNKDGSENKEFILNQPCYKNSEILVTGKNFGCGSSREHAVWALKDFGIKCLIGSEFADIFYNNCFKNGILPIELDQQDVDKLTFDAENKKKLTINLEEQLILRENRETINYKIDVFRKKCLLEGLDDIGLTFQKLKKIDIYEVQLSKSYPWII